MFINQWINCAGICDRDIKQQSVSQLQFALKMTDFDQAFGKDNKH